MRSAAHRYQGERDRAPPPGQNRQIGHGIGYGLPYQTDMSSIRAM
jgi:hypothetical protein